MNNSIYRFTLDLHKHNSERKINVYQFDNAVEVHIGFTDGGNPYFFSDGSQAYFYGKRADDKALLHACEFTKDKSEIVYIFNASTAAVVGVVDCQIRIYDGDKKLITAPRFTINVEAPVVEEDNMGIDDVNTQFQGIASIVSEEQARRAKEVERNTAEFARNTAEDSRSDAEKLRDQAEKERDAAEKERDTAEVARDLAETERKAAEQERKGVWVKYSAYADGTDCTDDWNEGQNYIGVATSHDCPTNKNAYVWARFKGETGEPFRIAKVYSSINAMNADFSNTAVPEGCFVAIDTGNVNNADNAKLYLKGETGFTFITDLSGAQGLRGEKGEKGDPGDIGRITPEAEDLILWAFATTGTYGLKYDFYNDYAVCAGVDGDVCKETDIEIGGTAKGLPVTAIQARAFHSNRTIQKVTISNSVTTIGAEAFQSCNALKEVDISSGVTSINNSVFLGCKALKTVIIPASVTKIYTNAFTQCDSLETVYFRGTPEQWEAITIYSQNECLTNAKLYYNYKG